jgi:hypothetical protein
MSTKFSEGKYLAQHTISATTNSGDHAPENLKALPGVFHRMPLYLSCTRKKLKTAVVCHGGALLHEIQRLNRWFPIFI